MPLSKLAKYQPDIFGAKLDISDAVAHYGISDKGKKLLHRVNHALFLLAFCSIASWIILHYQGGRGEAYDWSIVCTMVFFMMAVMGRFFNRYWCAINTLDLRCGWFARGKKTLLFSDIEQVLVYRNCYNNRRRSSIIHRLKDEDLANITIHIHFKRRLDPIVFGSFKSTDIALSYCKDLMQIIGYRGEIKIDGEYRPDNNWY